MNIIKKELHKRIFDISYQKGLSHIGSCITAVNIIWDIYNNYKLPEEKFVLSQGHAGLALYVVLEYITGHDAEIMYEKMGTHPDKIHDPYDMIDCSTGSLGHGVPIALGMALANRDKNVYCLTSDGELSEGSIYESANIMRKYKVKNLKVYVNCNGWTGYDKAEIRKKDFKDVFKFIDTKRIQNKYPYLSGLSGHYVKFTKESYEDTINRI